MRLDGPDSTRRNAKRLRREMTPPELALWQALRRNNAGLRFRRQHPAGSYVIDFYCAPVQLAVEVDGEAHERGDRPARDMARDAWLGARGVRVLRYSAKDVLTNLDGVVSHIMMAATRRRHQPQASPPSSPSVRLRLPPPPGGGG